METTITDIIVDAIINHAEDYTYIVMALIAIGTMYTVMIIARPVVLLLVKLTKTEKDDKYAKVVFDILDRFGPSFRKIEAYAKAKKKK